MDDFFSYQGVLLGVHILTTLAGLAASACQFAVDRRNDDLRGPRLWSWLHALSTVTLLGAWATATMRTSHGTPLRVPAMTLAMAGAMMWAVHWILFHSTVWTGLRTGGERAVTRALAARRVGTMLALPATILFASSVCAPQLGGGGRWIPHWFWLANFGIYAVAILGPWFTPRLVLTVAPNRLVAVVLGAATLGTLGLM